MGKRNRIFVAVRDGLLQSTRLRNNPIRPFLLHRTAETYFHGGTREPLMRREVESLRPPIFPGTFPVWQRFWARQADQGMVWALVDRRLSTVTAWTIPLSRVACSDLESGLVMGDFAGESLGHEGRRDRRGTVNVGLSAFHEGRGAGKTAPPGGHGLVSGKKIVSGKEKFRGKTFLISCSRILSGLARNPFMFAKYYTVNSGES